MSSPDTWRAKCPFCGGVVRNKPYRPRPVSMCRDCARVLPPLSADGVPPPRRLAN